MSRNTSSSNTGSFILFVLALAAIGAAVNFFKDNWPVVAIIGGAVLFFMLIVKLDKANKRKEAERLRQLEAQQLKEEQVKKRREAVERERSAAAARAAAQKESHAAPTAEAPADIEVPEEIDGAECAYQYEKIYFDLLPDINPNAYLGRKVRFDDNNGDIFVKVGSKRIGTMRSNRLADMVSDWLDRDDPIFAVVTYTNDDPLECAFDLYLYRKDKWDEEE